MTLRYSLHIAVRVGQPIVVQGRLRIREFTHDGERRFMPEVEANSLGHDLRWGLGSFSKPQRGGAAPVLGMQQRNELDKETHDWAMGSAAPATGFAVRAASGPANASGSLALLRGGADGDESVETAGAGGGAVRRLAGEYGAADHDADHDADHNAEHDTGHDVEEGQGVGREPGPGDGKARDETPWPTEVRMAA
ncbi:hypothetical protein AB0395_13385 [Streptosporangium sp. NPDC051023]|uniref:hypothetical protein n=1 Tax=Streptosporangium sp. NPDC051023 TaxID=3155410 RepID=UPI00344BF42E